MTTTATTTALSTVEVDAALRDAGEALEALTAARRAWDEAKAAGASAFELLAALERHQQEATRAAAPACFERMSTDVKRLSQLVDALADAADL